MWRTARRQLPRTGTATPAWGAARGGITGEWPAWALNLRRARGRPDAAPRPRRARERSSRCSPVRCWRTACRGGRARPRPARRPPGTFPAAWRGRSPIPSRDCRAAAARRRPTRWAQCVAGRGAAVSFRRPRTRRTRSLHGAQHAVAASDHAQSAVAGRGPGATKLQKSPERCRALADDMPARCLNLPDRHHPGFLEEWWQRSLRPCTSAKVRRECRVTGPSHAGHL